MNKSITTDEVQPIDTDVETIEEWEYSKYNADKLLQRIWLDVLKSWATKRIILNDFKTPLIQDQSTYTNKPSKRSDDLCFHDLNLIKHNNSWVFWFEWTLWACSRIIQINEHTKEVSYTDTQAHTFSFLGFSESWNILITAKMWACECLLDTDTGKPYSIIIDWVSSTKKNNFHEIIYLAGNNFLWKLWSREDNFFVPDLPKSKQTNKSLGKIKNKKQETLTNKIIKKIGQIL